MLCYIHVVFLVSNWSILLSLYCMVINTLCIYCLGQHNTINYHNSQSVHKKASHFSLLTVTFVWFIKHKTNIIEIHRTVRSQIHSFSKTISRKNSID